MGEKIIADALDTALARHYEQLGNTEREKVAVVFMDGRWVAIKADFTPDEIREAAEYIKHRRLTKEFGKALAELSPFAIKDGQVFIKDAFIQPDAIVSTKADSNSGGTTPYRCNMRINVDPVEKTAREKISEIVSWYMTDEAAEFAEDLVDDLMSLKVPAVLDETALDRLISERIELALQKETRPGGSVHTALKR